MDAVLGTLSFIFLVIWIVADIIRIQRWVMRLAARFGRRESVEAMLREMYPDNDYAGTRNAKQELRRYKNGG